MKLCDVTFRSAEENLACEEALLEACDSGGEEVLRLWKPADYFVVVGYANKVDSETNREFCRLMHIPILRRCSGGGTVLQGPGCFNYAVVLRIDSAPELKEISSTNKYILNRISRAFANLLHAPIDIRGHTDLALGGLKFSGNAQRRKREALLFHGSFLLDLDITLVEKALPMPSRQPDYRIHRSHSDFLVNLKVSDELLKQALIYEWQAREPLTDVPLAAIENLVRSKYGTHEWNSKF